MTILFSAAIALLAAQAALAEQRVNKPFNTVNGRTTTSAPAPRVVAVTAPGGGASSNSPGAGQAPAVTNAMITGAPSDGGRAFMGGGRQVAARSTGRAARGGGKAFWGSGRKVDGGDTTTTSAEEAPPHYSKPGALIRTTGQQPVYEKTETRTHTVDAGEIVLSRRKAIDSNRAPSVQQGPRDTPPPPNPVAGGGGYGTGASANSPASSSGSGGGNNNGSGNNGRDIPGDDDDGHGGDRARETSFNDAF